jgi:thiol-disulfide isomerase/thioredoxin
MKYTFRIIALLLLPLWTMANDGFVIKGKVTGIISGYVSIIAAEPMPERVRIVNGEFTYAGKLDHPQIVQLKVSTRTFSFFLENTNYTVNCSLDSLTSTSFKGGKLNAQWYDLLQSKKDPWKYFEENPKLEIGAWIAFRYAEKYDKATKAYDLLTPEARSSFEGKALLERINTYKKTSAGTPFPTLNMTDPSGKPFSISELKGKIVVIDFWASWCVPCIAYIPTMREHYNKYKDKDVVFVSVSVDDVQAKWMKAMNDQKMEWLQALAEGGFKDGVGIKKLFNISGIPYVLVIDKAGNMAASLDYAEKVNLEEVIQKLL